MIDLERLRRRKRKSPIVQARRDLARLNAAAWAWAGSPTRLPPPTSEYRTALITIYSIWTTRRPWRWLPAPVQRFAFRWLGRGWAARALERWQKPERVHG